MMMIITMQGVIGMVVTVVVLMSRKTFAQNVNVRIQVQEEMMEEMTEEMMVEMMEETLIVVSIIMSDI